MFTIRSMSWFRAAVRGRAAAGITARTYRNDEVARLGRHPAIHLEPSSDIPGNSLRVLRGGLSTAFKDGWEGRWQAAALASVGLDVAGAEANNRFSAAPSFFKVNLSLERAQPLGSHFTLVGRAVGQITSGTVPAAEVFTYRRPRLRPRLQRVGDLRRSRGRRVRRAALRDRLVRLPEGQGRPAPLCLRRPWLAVVGRPAQRAVFLPGQLRPAAASASSAFKKYTAELEFAKALDAPPIDVGSRPWRVCGLHGRRGF